MSERDPVEVVELILATGEVDWAKGHAHRVVTALRAAGLLRDEAREARMREVLEYIRRHNQNLPKPDSLIEVAARAALEDKP